MQHGLLEETAINVNADAHGGFGAPPARGVRASRATSTAGRRPSSGPSPVRDDASGTIAHALRERLLDGQRLLATSFWVCDENSLRRWRANVQAWRTRAARTLEECFGSETHREFLFATRQRSAEDTVRARLRSDGIRAREGIELLEALVSTLDGAKHGRRRRK